MEHQNRPMEEMTNQLGAYAMALASIHNSSFFPP